MHVHVDFYSVLLSLLFTCLQTEANWLMQLVTAGGTL